MLGMYEEVNSGLAQTLEEKAGQAAYEGVSEIRVNTKEEIEKRLLYTKNALIESVIVDKPVLVDRCEGGLSAEGVNFDPAKTFTEFTQKVGLNEDSNTGEVTFKNVAEEDTEDALKVYRVLKEARDKHLWLRLPVHFNTNMHPNIIGVRLREPETNTSRLITLDELKDILINKAAFSLNTAVPEVCVRAGCSKKSVYCIKWRGLSTLWLHPEIIEYYRRIKVYGVSTMKDRLHSELSCKYIEPGRLLVGKKVFRIPLFVARLELDEPSTEMKQVFDLGRRRRHRNDMNE